MAKFKTSSTGIFTALAVLLGAVTLAPEAKAFPPKNAMSGFGLIGRSHREITKAAILAVLSRDYGIKEATHSIENAIDEIAKANAAVDDDPVKTSILAGATAPPRPRKQGRKR